MIRIKIIKSFPEQDILEGDTGVFVELINIENILAVMCFNERTGLLNMLTPDNIRYVSNKDKK